MIEQLEEEIRTKEQLIYEQGHLIRMLESDTKFDAVGTISFWIGKGLGKKKILDAI